MNSAAFPEKRQQILDKNAVSQQADSSEQEKYRQTLFVLSSAVPNQ
ncbi:hypothetical protein [Burkholderia gladioli]|nr:hypothetical protein [Burkholderia gladioli]